MKADISFTILGSKVETVFEKIWAWLADTSKNLFRAARLALSECTYFFGVIRDIPVAPDSTPSGSTTHHVAYHPLIAVLPSPLTLSVFYVTEILRHYGELWQYFGMGSVCTYLHWDCNAMGGTKNTSFRVPSTCIQNAIFSSLIIHIIPSHQIFIAIDNP